MNQQSLPYEETSEINFKLAGNTTYRTLLQKKEDFLKDLQKETDFKKLDETLFVFMVSIEPENIVYQYILMIKLESISILKKSLLF